MKSLPTAWRARSLLKCHSTGMPFAALNCVCASRKVLSIQKDAPSGGYFFQSLASSKTFRSVSYPSKRTIFPLLPGNRTSYSIPRVTPVICSFPDNGPDRIKPNAAEFRVQIAQCDAFRLFHRFPYVGRTADKVPVEKPASPVRLVAQVGIRPGGSQPALDRFAKLFFDLRQLNVKI